MENITFTNINGNKFEMLGCRGEDVYSLAAGYIIRPDGLSVQVPDGEDHSDIYSQYIKNYLETEFKFYSSTDAVGVLHDEPFGCVVYFGVKTKDVKMIYGKGNEDSTGYGVVFLPVTELSLEQKLACQALLKSNKSVFGNRNKLELTIGYLNGEEISEDEFKKMIDTQKQM